MNSLAVDCIFGLVLALLSCMVSSAAGVGAGGALLLAVILSVFVALCLGRSGLVRRIAIYVIFLFLFIYLRQLDKI